MTSADSRLMLRIFVKTDPVVVDPRVEDPVEVVLVGLSLRSGLTWMTNALKMPHIKSRIWPFRIGAK